MARRRSYVSAFAQMQREAARAQAAQVRAQATAWREAERARAAYLRAQAAHEKERKRLYAESRAAEVAARNDDLEAEITALQDLLSLTFEVNDRISFSSLKKPAAVPPLQPAGHRLADRVLHQAGRRERHPGRRRLRDHADPRLHLPDLDGSRGERPEQGRDQQGLNGTPVMSVQYRTSSRRARGSG